MPSYQKLLQNPYLWLCLWAIPILSIGLLADQSIMAHDEGLYATRAKLMFDTGDWINPWQEPHHKPPGIYWIIALSYCLLGVNEIALRLPNLFLALGCVLLVYKITESLLNKQVALLAGGILCLEFLWVRYSYLANPDHVTIFLFLLAIALLCELSLGQKPNIQKSSALLFGIGSCLSLMVVFRGFLAFMLIFSLLPYLVQKKYWKKPLLYFGFIVGSLPLILWLFLSSQRFGYDSIASLINLFWSLSQEERRGNGYFYYLWTTIGLCFPWIIFAVLGYYQTLSKRPWAYSLVLVPPALIFIAITIYSTRLSHYSLSLYPFIAIFAAVSINSSLNNVQKQPLCQKAFDYTIFLLGTLGILILGVCAGFYSSQLFGLRFISPDVSEVFRQYSLIILSLGIGWSCAALFTWQKNFSQYSLVSLLLGHWIAFCLLMASGLITDISPDFKEAVQVERVQRVAQTQQVAAIGGGKTKVLIKFYFLNFNEKIQDVKHLNKNQYVWIDTEKLTKKTLDYEVIASFKSWQLIRIK